jgi:hypothetical protein
MWRRRIGLALLIAAPVGVGALACASGARASGILGSGVGPNLGPNLNPLPSIGELLHAIVNGLFGALLSALTPSFLRHADVHTLEWLVALPNVADASIWPTVGHLQQDMVWVAGAMLPTVLVVAATRDTALSLSFRAHPANALLRVLGAVFWLVLYRFAVQNGVAFVNVLTHTMLSWPIVAQGLHRTVLVMFGGSILTGAGGAFLGLLGLVALVFAVCLFALKVLLLMVLAVLFVSGPLLIALTPLPAVGHLAQGWVLALVGICLIPVGWCIIFATAGAISLDVTNLGGGAHIDSRIVGAFAALATFYIAFKWPLLVLGHVRGSLGALGVRPAGAGAGAGLASDGALATKAQGARARLQAAMLAGGRGIGLAAGTLGAPRGGLAGVARGQARPYLASAAAAGAIAGGQPRARPRPTTVGERIARAGDVLLGTPARMRAAWTASGRPSASGGRRAPYPKRRGRGSRGGRAAQSAEAARSGRSSRDPRGRTERPVPRAPKQAAPGGPARVSPAPGTPLGNAAASRAGAARDDGRMPSARERASAPARGSAGAGRSASSHPAGARPAADRRRPSAQADSPPSRSPRPGRWTRQSSSKPPRPRRGRKG